MRFRGLGVLLLLLTFAVSGRASGGSIRINGSTTVLPVAQEAAEAFMRENPDVEISVSGGGSGNGIKALIDGLTDIATSSRFLKPEEIALAARKGLYPVPFAVGYDCIVPVVHPANPVRNVTLGQLKGIYIGEIKNWKELGGPDLRIVAISRDTSSGTYEVWDEKVMKKDRVFPGALLQGSNGGIIQFVSRNKYAIGYAGIGYVDESVRALAVNGVPGDAETVLSGKYPIARALFMFTNGWPSGDALRFIRYMLDPQKGQKAVKGAAFVPLY